ncbi:WD-40 repeat-containing protein [Streptomyces sp. Ag109_G2-15]|nr:WD-40 repeat-containing protein [Streptomyces sp. Ag109_G2-15]
MGADDPPPPTLVTVPDWVVDRAESDQVVAAVCTRSRAVGITTALEGAGGFGKTTLAEVICAHPRVRRRFHDRIYFITMGRDVRGRAAIALKVAEATRFITGNTMTFDDPDLAGAHLGRLLDQRPNTLLVVDDVWEPEQLTPFLVGGRRCVRLVTTRIPAALPAGTQRVQVDEMSPVQARRVLTWGLAPLSEDVTQGLLKATGRWPLLLRLANRLIAAEVATGVDPSVAAEDTLRRLNENGPTGVDDPSASIDLDDPKRRKLAVRATVEAATRRLPAGGYERFSELCVFAEDEFIPLTVVAELWKSTGSLTATQTRQLCRALADLSLIGLSAEGGGHLTLHDVIRDYLRGEIGTTRLGELHSVLVDAVADGLPVAAPLATSAPGPDVAWWELTEGYLLDQTIAHMVAAGRVTQAEAVASDLRWVEARLYHRGPTAPWIDLSRIPTHSAATRARDLARIAHLLAPTDPPEALRAVLYSRLEPLTVWHEQVLVLQAALTQPALINRWRPPDLPDPALQRSLTCHRGWVNAVSTAPDGKTLATGSEDSTVLIWDATAGRLVATLTGPAGAVNAVAFSPDGTWLAASGQDSSVWIWETATGVLRATLTGHASWVHALAISPDGQHVVTGGTDARIQAWDTATGTLATTLIAHSGVSGMAFSRDGVWLATSHYDGAVRVWDWGAGTLTATLTGHTGAANAVSVSADGAWIASGGNDGTVRIWDRAVATLAATLTGHRDWVNAVAFSADGARLVSGGNDGMALVWDRASASACAALTGHRDWVRAVAFAPDGTWIATGGSDVRIWDVDAAGMTDATDIGGAEAVTVAPSGLHVATGGEDTTARLWDVATGRVSLNLDGHEGAVTSIAYSPDGARLATSDDSSIRIWDPDDGNQLTRLNGLTAAVSSMAFSPNGAWLATAETNAEVRLWDVDTGGQIGTLAGHRGWVGAVAVAPDGAWLATGGEDGALRLWDPNAVRRTRTLTGHHGWIGTIAVAPDGAWLASGGEDGVVRLWQVATGQLTASLEGHAGPVRSVAFSPDGTRLASTGRDGTLRIWDWRQKRASTLMRTDNSLVACAWLPDGSGIVAGGRQGAYLYELRT